MDRMPKEFKLVFYLTFVHTIYMGFYFAGLFYKLSRAESTLRTACLITGIITLAFFVIPLILFFFRIQFGRIWLIFDYFIQSLIMCCLIPAFIFFRETATLISKAFSTGIFFPYLLAAVLGLTPDRAYLAFIIILAWSIYNLVLLFNKELKTYIKTGEYQLTNSQRYVSIVMIVYFASLALLTFLINL